MKIKKEHPFVVWFTGLSGSGKSTLANALEEKLKSLDYSVFNLDGDKLRNGINQDLSFSKEDRSENIRRVGEITKLFLDAGLCIVASFISPYEKDRLEIRKKIGNSNFIEVYVSTPIETCEERDVKGLYEKARNGIIKNFTGISAPYEPPIAADLEIDTSELTVSQAIDSILEYILDRIIAK